MSKRTVFSANGRRTPARADAAPGRGPLRAQTGGPASGSVPSPGRATLRQRRLPQRTCVACRGTTEKRELVRLVRNVEGRVEVDPTGKKAGRGAYLCRRLECWQEALRKDRLSHALRTKLTEADREALWAQGQALLGAIARP